MPKQKQLLRNRKNVKNLLDLKGGVFLVQDRLVLFLGGQHDPVRGFQTDRCRTRRHGC